jgi:hypothetical protein
MFSVSVLPQTEEKKEYKIKKTVREGNLNLRKSSENLTTIS